MDALTLFGLVAVTAMLACYALEDASPWWTLAFAAACLLVAAYGFMQGAWPFGVLEVVWAGIAALRWRRRRADGPVPLTGSAARSKSGRVATFTGSRSTVTAANATVST